MPFVSCSKFDQSQATQDQAIADLAQELLTKQNALNDCSGNPLAGTVPTCAQMNTAISSAIAGGTSPTGAAGGDLEGAYPNPTVKDQAIVDAVTGSHAVQTAVAGVFDDCSGNALDPRSRLIECSAKGTDIPYLVSGVIPATQLPAYVDDVLEFPALANFPATGEAGKIYIDASTGKTYRWNGSSFTEISASAGLTAQNEGSVLTTAATSLNFIGTAVTATSSGGAVSVNVDAVTPAQMDATLVNYADTNVATGNVLVPTGTPTGNGTNYATNSNGELFMYNKVTGAWVLVANGHRMSDYGVDNLTVANLAEPAIASFVMPRDGWVQVNAFTSCISNSTNIGAGSRMATGISLRVNGATLYNSDTNVSNYATGDGFSNSLAGVVGVAAGSVLDFYFALNNTIGHTVTLHNHNAQLYYVS